MATAWLTGTIYFLCVHGRQWLVAGITAALLALAYLPYLVRSRDIYRATNQVPRIKTAVRYARLAAAIEEVDPVLTDARAWLYIQLILSPRDVVQRVGETIEPSTRSYRVSASHSLLIPIADLGGVAILPLILARKGHLLDHFKIESGSGERYSTLAQEQSIAFTVVAMRKIVGVCGVPALNKYLTTCDAEVQRILSQPKNIRPNDGSYTTLRATIQSCAPEYPDVTGALLNVLSVFERQYPIIIVETGLDDGSSGGLDGAARHGMALRRFHIERREIPILIDAEGSFDEMKRWVSSIFGIRPARITWPIPESLRCQSYHLETIGPATTYLASQQLVDGVTLEQQDPVAIASQAYCLPRSGQRYGHLYINGRDEEPPTSLVYDAKFYERPPGSIAGATLSAFASLAIMLVAATSVLVERFEPPGNLVAVLLAVPAVASAWGGFEKDSSVFGGTVGSRVARLATMLLSLSAAAYYVLGPFHGKQIPDEAFIDRPGARVWIVILSLSSYCFLHCALSWVLRSTTYNFFIKRSETDLYPDA